VVLFEPVIQWFLFDALTSLIWQWKVLWFVKVLLQAFQVFFWVPN